MLVDHLMNTDARSVLVCSPWETLIGRTPFTRYRSGFGSELLHSLEGGAVSEDLGEIRSGIETLRAKTSPPEVIPLEELEGWKITDFGVAPCAKGPFVVRHIEVEARGREVPVWDQPIIDSSDEGSVALICGRRGGILHFLFRGQGEAGLYHRVELGPSVDTGTGGIEAVDIPVDYPNAVLRAECRQSEEGGRFFQDVNHYRILDVDQALEVPFGWYWLTLAQIRTLLDGGGWLTNEARSALALLLHWL
ncbi:MAG: NDP-hexose 2,3-dehydratase family protein [Chloroflexi bacterium]|nr:NDP-hexose 2,3-dehydratase family protein [Chloroflexota bacterium]